MKLAEALILRADLQRRIEHLRERLKLSSLIQEGDLPPEQPQALLAELDRILDQLMLLITQINGTNFQSTLRDGTSLTEALARRDVLRLRSSVLKSLADHASQRTGHYRRSEIRYVAALDIMAVRQQTDRIALQHRELDTAIQEANWRTDIIL